MDPERTRGTRKIIKISPIPMDPEGTRGIKILLSELTAREKPRIGPNEKHSTPLVLPLLYSLYNTLSRFFKLFRAFVSMCVLSRFFRHNSPQVFLKTVELPQLLSRSVKSY